MTDNINKTARARELGISRSSLYYTHTQPPKDWKLKCLVEEVLREHPSYGYRRISIALKRNHKPVQRVMQKYGIKAYRRRGRKPKRRANKSKVDYPNLLLFTYPEYPNHIWVSDFTYLWFKKQWVYVATVMDLFTRVITGYSVLTNHSVQLVMNALLSALHHYPRPEILHSDHGSEYTSKSYVDFVESLTTQISMAGKGRPWENGYQESFYDKFKIDLGDPGRFEHLGELVCEIQQTMWKYNNTRIHSALKMPPLVFSEKFANNINTRIVS